ncbi:MAG: hypothetical protein ABI591_24655 [Kofleriaceae bacterium]
MTTTRESFIIDAGRIADPEVLARLRLHLDEDALVIEHRFFPSERTRHRFICDDFAELERYLREHSKPGDSFSFWSFLANCRTDNTLERGKVP